IWLVNFDPSFGHEYRKVRPALIIEDTKYLSTGSLIAIIPITSIVEKRAVLDIQLPKSGKNRLMKDSLIKLHQISSFDKRRFIKFIGDCDQNIFEAVLENLKKFLSLSPPYN
ncbi:MAG: type II toxin-antitoxin system PemK/MazF family toxin, partial [bacterium]|nr:type II toxin-antitoxin system PemK/MazF family toxin [bacterium]